MSSATEITISKLKRNLIISTKSRLAKKFQTDKNSYNVKLINDIIYNEKSHLVSIFKDFLILDDLSEFLKR